MLLESVCNKIGNRVDVKVLLLGNIVQIVQNLVDRKSHNRLFFIYFVYFITKHKT